MELVVGDLVPCLTERMILMDGDDGVAKRAAGRLLDLGYTNVHIVDGSVTGWERAGLSLYKDVNVSMKTLGELVERSGIHNFCRQKSCSNRPN